MKNIKRYIQIDKNRFREDYGLYYEDFVIGTIIEHWPGRTLTETDNIWQSLVCMNNHPLHFDEIYASTTEFGKPLISSAVTFSIINGMTVSSLSAKAIANLEWDKVRLLKPVYVGDTIYASSEIIDKRDSKSRSAEGIISVITKGLKANKELFLTFERTFLVPKYIC